MSNTVNIEPVGLQRKRIKGFRLISPNGLDNTYVGWPSKWGNPWRNCSKQIAFEKYLEWITKGDGRRLLAELGELKRKNLVCWCGEDDPYCHRNILLDLANDWGEYQSLITGEYCA